jgi:hypothetical protein
MSSLCFFLFFNHIHTYRYQLCCSTQSFKVSQQFKRYLTVCYHRVSHFKFMTFIKSILGKLGHLIPNCRCCLFTYTISYTSFYIKRFFAFLNSFFIFFCWTIYEILSVFINNVFNLFQFMLSVRLFIPTFWSLFIRSYPRHSAYSTTSQF